MVRCPTCDAAAGASVDACPAGHALAGADGVIRLLPGPLEAQVAALEAAVEVWRRESGRRELPPEALADLPGGRAVQGDPEWRLRRADLALVRRLLAHRAGGDRPSTGIRVLDVGAWNGWLSARLADDGHAVTALDLFAGPTALGIRSQLVGAWRAIQADPMDLSRLDEVFDVVIVNRCLAFQPDPAGALRGALAVLNGGGTLIVTGIAIHRHPEVARQRLEQERAAFRARFGMDLLLRPAAGVMDDPALRELERLGLVVRDHPCLRRANIRARFDRSRPRHRYGVVQLP